MTVCIAQQRIYGSTPKAFWTPPKSRTKCSGFFDGKVSLEDLKKFMSTFNPRKVPENIRQTYRARNKRRTNFR
jgi:hypothetical protein